MEAFVYCWTDWKTEKLYIGAHKGSIDDGYICSSKTMKEEYLKRPTDFTRQIIAHGTYPEMIRLEERILCAANARKDPGFYNMHNGNGKWYTKGPRSAETKRKIGEANTGNHKSRNKGNKRPDLTLHNQTRINPWKGKTFDPEYRRKISEGIKRFHRERKAQCQ